MTKEIKAKKKLEHRAWFSGAQPKTSEPFETCCFFLGAMLFLAIPPPLSDVSTQVRLGSAYG